jgi:polysaccharide transporter, PST family
MSAPVIDAPHAPEASDGLESDLNRETSAGSGEVRRAAVKGVAWTALQTWGYNFMALGSFVVLARLLTPADFGLAAAAMVVIQFVRFIVDAGFGRRLIQREEISPIDADTAFWTALGIGGLFAALTVAGAPLLALIFSQPRLTLIIRVLSLVFIFAALDSTQVALLQRAMQFRLQAIRQLAATTVSGVVALVLAGLGAGVWALVAQQLTLELLLVSLLWTMTSWRPRARFSGAAFRDLAGFGVSYSGIRILTYLSTNADNFLIGVVLGPVALGVYVIAYRVLIVLNELVVNTINIVALPTLSRLAGERSLINAALCRASSAAAMFAFPVYVGLAVVAHPLVRLVFGARWSESATVLQVLALAGLVQCQTTFLSSYALAVGRVRNELVWTLGLVVVQVAGFVAVVHWGIVAVAAVVGAVLAIAWPTRLLLVRRWGGPSLTEYLGQLPAIAGATLLMAAVVVGLRSLLAGSDAVVILIIQVAAGSATYLLTLWVLCPAAILSLAGNLGQLRR